MNTDSRPADLRTFDIAALPLHERVLDGLADLLFDVDSVLDMLKTDRAPHLSWVTPKIQRVYDDVNDLMKRLSD